MLFNGSGGDGRTPVGGVGDRKCIVFTLHILIIPVSFNE